MGNKVRLKLDPTQKILLKRGLNKNGAAQRFFSNELRRKMDPYVRADAKWCIEEYSSSA